MSKNFQDLTIKDAFMFAAVMSDEKQCRRFLELVLETKILAVSVIAEKSLEYRPDYHGVRLDVLAEEAGQRRRFNVEMQVKRKPDLPWRSRYYHSQLDMNVLATGKSYKELPETYVIFICDFLWLPDQLYRYTYEMVCRENGHALRPGQTTIFLSTKGKNDSEVPVPLVDFLKYVENPQNVSEDTREDAFVSMVEERIRSIKRSRKWEAKFMRLEIELMERWQEGHAEGSQAGKDRVNKLNELLAQKGRVDDIVKAATDSNFQEELFEEFGL